MSDKDDTKTAEELEAEKAVAAKAADGDDELTKAQAEVEKWKAMARKHEGQAKLNAEAARKLKDAEDAQKSAEERAAARLAELEAKVNATESRAMRAEVAAAKGLTAAQAKRLQGATIEELEADADDLLESFKPAGKGGEPDTGEGSGKPKEKLRSGAAPGAEPEENNPTKLAESIPRDRF